MKSLNVLSDNTPEGFKEKAQKNEVKDKKEIINSLSWKINVDYVAINETFGWVHTDFEGT